MGEKVLRTLPPKNKFEMFQTIVSAILLICVADPDSGLLVLSREKYSKNHLMNLLDNLHVFFFCIINFLCQAFH